MCTKIFITSLISFSSAGTHYHLPMHYIVSNSNNWGVKSNPVKPSFKGSQWPFSVFLFTYH